MSLQRHLAHRDLPGPAPQTHLHAGQAGRGGHLDSQALFHPVEAAGPRPDPLLGNRFAIGVEEDDDQARALLGQRTRLHLLSADPQGDFDLAASGGRRRPPPARPARPGPAYRFEK